MQQSKSLSQSIWFILLLIPGVVVADLTYKRWFNIPAGQTSPGENIAKITFGVIFYLAIFCFIGAQLGL
jgi:hypothetical protein